MPEAKRDSIFWRHPYSSPMKKFKLKPSAKKNIADVLWHAQSICNTLTFLKQCKTIEEATTVMSNS